MPLVEKRYAEALITIAAEQNSIDKYQKDLGAVEEIYSIDTDFKNFLLNPENDTNVKKSIIQKVFDGKIQHEVICFIKLLLDKGRIINLTGIFREFVQMADEKRSILNISILSAAPLDTAQINAITEKYRQQYGAWSVKAEMKIDPSLIGGIKISIGDKLIDGTVKGRLKDLKALLVK